MFKWYAPHSVDGILEGFHNIIEDLTEHQVRMKNKIFHHADQVEIHTQAQAEAQNEHDRAEAVRSKIIDLVN